MLKHALIMGVCCGFLAGCAVQEGPSVTTDKTAAVSATAQTSAASGFYSEKEHNGRLYVFGTEKTLTASRETPQISYAKTFIGAGPGGKTVVVEADSKDPALQERLIAEFSRRHGLQLK